MTTQALSTALGLASFAIDPVSQAPATVTSGALHLQDTFDRAMFLLLVGAIGGAGTVDAKLQQDATGVGGWTDVAGSNITQITASSKMVTLEMRRDQLSPSGPQAYIRLSVTVGGNAVLIAALGIGAYPLTPPASANDVPNVTQRLQVP
jgi:hypothetical protein